MKLANGAEEVRHLLHDSSGSCKQTYLPYPGKVLTHPLVPSIRSFLRINPQLVGRSVRSFVRSFLPGIYLARNRNYQGTILNQSTDVVETPTKVTHARTRPESGDQYNLHYCLLTMSSRITMSCRIVPYRTVRL